MPSRSRMHACRQGGGGGTQGDMGGRGGRLGACINPTPRTRGSAIDETHACSTATHACMQHGCNRSIHALAQAQLDETHRLLNEEHRRRFRLEDDSTRLNMELQRIRDLEARLMQER